VDKNKTSAEINGYTLNLSEAISVRSRANLEIGVIPAGKPDIINKRIDGFVVLVVSNNATNVEVIIPAETWKEIIKVNVE